MCATVRMYGQQDRCCAHFHGFVDAMRRDASLVNSRENESAERTQSQDGVGGDIGRSR